MPLQIGMVLVILEQVEVKIQFYPQAQQRALLIPLVLSIMSLNMAVLYPLQV